MIKRNGPFRQARCLLWKKQKASSAIFNKKMGMNLKILQLAELVELISLKSELTFITYVSVVKQLIWISRKIIHPPYIMELIPKFLLNSITTEYFIKRSSELKSYLFDEQSTLLVDIFLNRIFKLAWINKSEALRRQKESDGQHQAEKRLKLLQIHVHSCSFQLKLGVVIVE
ncbi:hypothetical protein Tsp_12188, partial [Trichinella spiralis]|uniref:hypothetical protein n=1 Tax=Trichinella spiralis TaxID=6334 RepID=UPI0001EFB675